MTTLNSQATRLALGRGVAAVLRRYAATIRCEINGLEQPRRENTPKRQREAMARRCRIQNLEQTHRALITLAEAHEQDADMPEFIRELRKRTEIAGFVERQTESEGYYHVRLSDRYRDEGYAACVFRQWIADRQGNQYAALDAELKKKARIHELTEGIRFGNIPGFFPTPDDLAAKVIEWADIKPGMTVLEPSAGIGNLAKHAVAAGGEVVCYEINHRCAEVLELMGFRVIRLDFLSYHPQTVDCQYDRIVMNPPFENGADADHVQHAYGFLKPGGRLVAIVSPGFQMSRGQRFADWLVKVGAYMLKNPDGSFKDSFCPTAVNSYTLIIDKD